MAAFAVLGQACQEEKEPAGSAIEELPSSNHASLLNELPYGHPGRDYRSRGPLHIHTGPSSKENQRRQDHRGLLPSMLHQSGITSRETDPMRKIFFFTRTPLPSSFHFHAPH